MPSTFTLTEPPESERVYHLTMTELTFDKAEAEAHPANKAKYDEMLKRLEAFRKNMGAPDSPSN